MRAEAHEVISQIDPDTCDFILSVRFLFSDYIRRQLGLRFFSMIREKRGQLVDPMLVVMIRAILPPMLGYPWNDA